ncbi:uncharacterized protein [Venturia canescens]|uniref:uncharacterized protein n=1 Tax=Venturia canescens TaxID=32260 RepID=UPI001C9CAED6|nr:uncharacterized protein LOC122416786 [Venturia canescens]
MPGDSTYCFKGTDDFYIENGILKGHESAYLGKHTSYGEFILERLKSRPDFVGQVNALTDEEETFATMLEKSVKCAMWLKKQNVNPGDIVGVCTHNQMDMYVPCFAALFIGAVFNPWWDVGLAHDITKHFLNLTTPKVVFVNEDSAAKTSEVAKEIGVESKVVVLGNLPGFLSLNEILASQDGKLVAEFQCTKLSSVDDPAMIVYTSGTTGLPKGALHSHRSLFGNLNIARALGASQSIATTMIFSSLSWISGVLLMFRGISAVERRIIYPDFDEEKTFQLIEKYRVNWMLMGTSMAFRLQKSPAIVKYDSSSLKFIYIGGAVCKDEIQKAMARSFPHTNILQAYGATELGGASLQQSPDFKPSSCGRLVKNLSMKVIDPESGRILGPNETGEACFKSPFMLTCYYRNPEGTKKTVDSEGWLHSGDLVHYDEEGHIFVTDRIKEMIKYRGNHVSPAMIEQVLQTHPGVKESAVLGIPHDSDEEHAIAFVVKTADSKATKDELQKMVADALPDYMKLRGGIMFLDELPHTSSGKVGRTQLRKLALSYINIEKLEKNMSSNSTYCCKVSDDIVIENGIIKGVEKSYNIDHHSFGEMILERLKARPTFVGQVDGVTGREETFEEMMKKSVKCALWMRQQNIKAGDIVGICTHNQMDMYIPCFASLFIGAVYNPWWDVGLTKEVTKHFVELMKPKMLFLTNETVELVLEVIEEIGAKISIVIFGENSKYLALNSVLKSQDPNKVSDFRCTKLSSLKEPAMVLYTSGSTGLPKGVVYSNESLFTNMYQYAELNKIDILSTTLLFSPLSWVTGAYTMLRGIIVPDRRIIHPEYTPQICLELIEKYKINWLLLGPSAAVALDKCSTISKYNVSSLKVFFIGGSVIRKETQMSLMESFPNAVIFQGYGSTELGGAGVAQKKGFKMGSIGRVMENKQLKVIDPETGRILNPNETGEACFKTKFMMLGYYKNPEATKETIDSEGWLHTGDLVYYDEDGDIFFVDRLKELIKFRGLHVSPTMIENVLGQHPAIKEAAVVSILHGADGEHPIAFVEKKAGFQITEDEIQKMVADVLPDYMKLRGGVKFLDKMPHTSSGKIARRELKILANSYIQQEVFQKTCILVYQERRIFRGEFISSSVSQQTIKMANSMEDSTFNCTISEEIVIRNGIMEAKEKMQEFGHEAFGEMILSRMRTKPTFVGQVDGVTGREETFAEMMEKSVKCALWMRQQNIKPGDVVGICTHNQMDMYIPCFASLFIGAVYNPWWDVGLTKDLAKYFIELTDPKVLFLTDVTAEIVLKVMEETGTKIPVVIFGGTSNDVSLKSILDSQDTNEVANFRCTKLSSPEEAAIILYTSGSTELPKGVVISNNSLFTNIHLFSKLNDLESAVTLLFSPLSWVSGAWSMLHGIVVPNRKIIHPEYTPEKCFELIEKYKVSWLFLGPTAAIALEKNCAVLKYDTSSVKFMLIGGSVIAKEKQMSLAKMFPRAFICQAYGSTEAGGIIVAQKRNAKIGSIGRLIGNTQLKVIDPETGRILNPNETGEACFKNTYMMKGYYRNPETTRETIDTEGWLHSGDLLYYDEEGNLFFVDRLKELIKFRGNHVSPTMIEHVLNQHPAIKEAAVVSIMHEADGEHPIAFVEIKSGFQITAKEIEKMVSDALPDHMKLRGGVKFLNKMPHTTTEKISRKELKKLTKARIQ